MKFIFILALNLVLATVIACGDSGKSSDNRDTDDSGNSNDSGNGSDAGPDKDDASPVSSGWPHRLTILNLNHLQSGLNGFGPESQYTPDSVNDDKTFGGVARMATIIERVREQVKGDVLVFEAGDSTTGTAFSMITTAYAPEMRAYDALGMSAITIGNHDLDGGPDIAAQIIRAGRSVSHIPVLASNLVTSSESDADDAVEALFDEGIIEREVLLSLPSGLRVGLIGLLGVDAADKAPGMAPLSIRPLDEAAQEYTDSLKSKGADIVVALSHSGIKKGPEDGEDEVLAKAVDGLDIIVSGHTYAALTEVEGDADTFIVQAGDRAQYLGQLTLDVYENRVALVDYQLITVDDSVPGDPAVQKMVDEMVGKVNEALNPYGFSYDQVLAESDFDLSKETFAESGLGDLVTDAVLAAANEFLTGQTQVIAAVDANGEIFDSLYKGRITVADAFRTRALGYGPDGVMGYPMITFYLTADELRQVCEVMVWAPTLLGDDDYTVQVSGLRFIKDPVGDLFDSVRKIYLKQGNAYSDTPLDLSKTNTELYRVATNYFLGEMIAVVSEQTAGLLTITPKDENGTPIKDLATTMIDTDPSAEGVQEMKYWWTLLWYLSTFEDTDGDNIPNLPNRYRQSEGRCQDIS